MKIRFSILVGIICVLSMEFVWDDGYSETKPVSSYPICFLKTFPYVSLTGFTEQFNLELFKDANTKILTLQNEIVDMKAREDSRAILVNGQFYFLKTPLASEKGELLIPYQFMVKEFPRIFANLKAIRKKFIYYQQLPDFTVVIDPGHGGNDPGACSIDGTMEKDINLDTCLRIEKRLKDKGFKVVLTRNRDQFVSLARRISLAREHSAQLFLSIHTNAASTDASGIEIFYPAKVDERFFAEKHMGMLLARQLEEKLQKRLDVVSRGLKPGDFKVLRNAQYTALLIEVGFLTNTEDLELLKKQSLREIVADVISEEVIAFYKTYSSRMKQKGQ